MLRWRSPIAVLLSLVLALGEAASAWAASAPRTPASASGAATVPQARSPLPALTLPASSLPAPALSPAPAAGLSKPGRLPPELPSPSASEAETTVGSPEAAPAAGPVDATVASPETAHAAPEDAPPRAGLEAPRPSARASLDAAALAPQRHEELFDRRRPRPEASPVAATEALSNIAGFYRVAPAAPRAAPPAPPASRLDTGAWHAVDQLAPRLLALGHLRPLSRTLRRVVQRLVQPGDRADYALRLKSSVFPHAGSWADRALIELNLGVLSLTASEDELAAVLALHMARANPDRLPAQADGAEALRALERLDVYKDLPPTHREDVRADIASVDRLLAAGYNPWAAYDHHKKMAGVHARLKKGKLLRWILERAFTPTAGYIAEHPEPELRMSAIKAYILQKGFKEDTTDAVSGRVALPGSLRALRWRLRPLTAFTLWPVTWWLVGAAAAFKALTQLLGFLVPETSLALVITGEKATSAAERFFSAAAALLYDWLEPVRETAPWRAVSPAFHWTLDLFGGGGGLTALLLGGGCVLSLAHIAYRGYRNDPHYPVLRTLRRGLAATARAAARPRGLDDAALERRLNASLDHLAAVEEIYLSRRRRADEGGSNVVRGLRYFDGLTPLRYLAPALFRRLLTERLRRLEALPPDRRRESAADAAVLLARPLPAFAAEDARLRGLWLRLADAAGVELPPEHPAVLAARADALRRSGTPEELLRLAPALERAGLFNTLRRLMFARDRELFAAAIAPKVPGQRDLADAWLTAERAIRRRKTLGRAGALTEWRRERRAWRRRLRRLFSPLDERLAAAALIDRLPIEGSRFLSLRYLVGLADRALLTAQFSASFRSASQAAAYVESRLRPRAVSTLAIRPMLQAAVLRRPGWLAGSGDLEALMVTDEFWPQLGEQRGGPMEAALLQIVDAYARKLPGPWSYEPAASQALHARYLERLDALGLAPKDVPGRAALWRRLTERGVTAATDAMFERLAAEAEGPLREALESDAVAGRVWDPALRARIAERRFRESELYRDLRSAPPKTRQALLESAVQALERDFPDRNVHYVDLLERLSEELRSDPKESAFLQARKTSAAGEGGDKSEDATLRLMNQLFAQTLQWRRSQQWKFLLFLRGDAPPSRKVRRAFRTIGPERVKRLFDSMPQAARVAALDAFLDTPRGLAGKVSARRGWAGVIVDHMLPKDDPEARRVAREILEALLYALDKTGNKGFQSFVLAYMLALPKSDTDSIGRTLKSVLEIFGATGVKLGQFLAASGLLGPDATRELRELQERAAPPLREQAYADLREIGGREELPFRLLERLGAASIKYAYKALERETGRETVLKVFRLSALAHTRQEFARLDFMAQFMRRKGPRYGALRAIVGAAKKAVKRELSAAHEIERSDIARERLYAGRGRPGVELRVPLERLAHARLIVSEFAEGVPLSRLDERARVWAAREILSLERDVLFGDRGLIDFDPDRHPGNYRLHLEGDTMVIRPIDAGQGLTIRREDRERIVSLFALAQLARDGGPTRWLGDELARLMGADAPKRRALNKTLRYYFPDRGLAREAAYFSLLAALEEAGIEVDVSHFDFVRGIVQFQQYVELVPDHRDTPQAALEAAVRARADEYLLLMRMTRGEKLAAGWQLLKDWLLERRGLRDLRQALWEPRKRRWAQAAAGVALYAGAVAAHPAFLWTPVETATQWAGAAWTRTADAFAETFDSDLKLERELAELSPEMQDSVLWKLIENKGDSDVFFKMRDYDPRAGSAALALGRRIAAGKEVSADQLRDVARVLWRITWDTSHGLVLDLIELAEARGDRRWIGHYTLSVLAQSPHLEQRLRAARKLADFVERGIVPREEAFKAYRDALGRTRIVSEGLALTELLLRLEPPGATTSASRPGG